MSGHTADTLGAFAQRLVAWQRDHGRHGLPWQSTRDPYRVWLSEVMLQQTQVVTVLGYFDKFLARFPTLAELAAAPVDDVLSLWSGLGYYSRARNLHRCAQTVMTRHGGVFPCDVTALEALPGIGPSTAAALAAFCCGQRVSIYDGNVKRVIARYVGFARDLSVREADRALFAHAQSLLPDQLNAADMPAYTQGLMDLGATVCTRHQPRCDACPLVTDCVARATSQQAVLPLKTRRLVRKTQAWTLLVLRRTDGRVWLQQRPDKGIWASLFAFPSAHSPEEVLASVGLAPSADMEAAPSFVHALTHLDMAIQPVQVDVAHDWQPASVKGSVSRGFWVRPDEPLLVGVPVPVTRILASLVTASAAGHVPSKLAMP
ncbi:MAG: A/G-specific adenine glycosylase [Burkholderiales bacterium]|nr:A/G-specific adenine glycosylase [Burkholderiales bacterium]